MSLTKKNVRNAVINELKNTKLEKNTKLVEVENIDALYDGKSIYFQVKSVEDIPKLINIIPKALNHLLPEGSETVIVNKNKHYDHEQREIRALVYEEGWESIKLSKDLGLMFRISNGVKNITKYKEKSLKKLKDKIDSGVEINNPDVKIEYKQVLTHINVQFLFLYKKTGEA